MPEAFDNCERDRVGCTADWYNVTDCDGPSDEQGRSIGFRVTSHEAQDIAAKLSTESDKWFQHNSTVSGPHAKVHSDAVKEAIVRHQGSEMRHLLEGDASTNSDVKLDMNPGRQTRHRMTPDAQRFAVLSQQGTVNRVLNFESNEGYQSPGRCPRAVKPEAAATFERNKGCMADCLQVWTSSAVIDFTKCNLLAIIA
jgi:hypothetical protein